MKIVIATGTFPPEASGQSTFISQLVKNFPDGVEVNIVAYGNDSPEDKRKNVTRIKRGSFRYFRYWKYRNAVRKFGANAEIIYAQDLGSSGFPAALAKRKNNKFIIRLGGDFLWEKMVNSGRCVVPFEKYYDQKKSLLEKIYLQQYKYVMRKCDGIIFNSEFQKKIYEKYFKIKDKKITVIENSHIV